VQAHAAELFARVHVIVIVSVVLGGGVTALTVNVTGTTTGLFENCALTNDTFALYVPAASVPGVALTVITPFVVPDPGVTPHQAALHDTVNGVAFGGVDTMVSCCVAGTLPPVDEKLSVVGVTLPTNVLVGGGGGGVPGIAALTSFEKPLSLPFSVAVPT